jgi:hypothetical protein
LLAKAGKVGPDNELIAALEGLDLRRPDADAALAQLAREFPAAREKIAEEPAIQLVAQPANRAEWIAPSHVR